METALIKLEISNHLEKQKSIKLMPEQPEEMRALRHVVIANIIRNHIEEKRKAKH